MAPLPAESPECAIDDSPVLSACSHLSRLLLTLSARSFVLQAGGRGRGRGRGGRGGRGRPE